MEYLHSEITGKIIESFYKVHKKLGFGFLEKVYERALAIELTKNGLKVETQKKIEVYYDDFKVGVYFADLLVEDKVIIEIKAGEGIVEEHEAQLINYLKATEMEVGLLLNFGKTAQLKRKIYSNDRKQ